MLHWVFVYLQLSHGTYFNFAFVSMMLLINDQKSSAGSYLRLRFLPNQHQDHFYQLICLEFTGAETFQSSMLLQKVEDFHNSKSNAREILVKSPMQAVFTAVTLVSSSASR